MTPTPLRAKAEALADEYGHEQYRRELADAIHTALVEARTEALEESAECADFVYGAKVGFGTDDKEKRVKYDAMASAADDIANAIRALKEPT